MPSRPRKLTKPDSQVNEADGGTPQTDVRKPKSVDRVKIPSEDGPICKACRDAGKAHARCYIDHAVNAYECTSCSNNSKELCSYSTQRLRFFATDFFVKHFGTVLGEKPCESCKLLCTEGETCAICKMNDKGPKRLCEHPGAVFGWCGKATAHTRGWDYEDQPSGPRGTEEDHMRFYYIEYPEECAAPWSPLYVRKVLEEECKR